MKYKPANMDIKQGKLPYLEGLCPKKLGKHLVSCSKHNHKKLVYKLLKHYKPDVNVYDVAKNNALYYAVGNKDVVCVHLLLASGINPNLINYQGVSPFSRAIRLLLKSETESELKHNRTVLELLLKYGGDPELVYKFGKQTQSIYDHLLELESKKPYRFVKKRVSPEQIMKHRDPKPVRIQIYKKQIANKSIGTNKKHEYIINNKILNRCKCGPLTSTHNCFDGRLNYRTFTCASNTCDYYIKENLN